LTVAPAGPHWLGHAVASSRGPSSSTRPCDDRVRHPLSAPATDRSIWRGSQRSTSHIRSPHRLLAPETTIPMPPRPISQSVTYRSVSNLGELASSHQLVGHGGFDLLVVRRAWRVVALACQKCRAHFSPRRGKLRGAPVRERLWAARCPSP